MKSGDGSGTRREKEKGSRWRNSHGSSAAVTRTEVCLGKNAARRRGLDAAGEECDALMEAIGDVPESDERLLSCRSLLWRFSLVVVVRRSRDAGSWGGVYDALCGWREKDSVGNKQRDVYFRRYGV